MTFPILRTAAIAIASLTGFVNAGSVVDFESLPNGESREGMMISDQYAQSSNMTFSTEAGGSVYLSQVGGDFCSAFWGPNNSTGADVLAPSTETGSFFITDDGLVFGSNVVHNLVVRYSSGVANAWGSIIDLDGLEKWNIEARDQNDGIIETLSLDASSAGAGDGVSTGWAFARPTNDIWSICLRYMGDSSLNVGFAFDNFGWDYATPPQAQSIEIAVIPLPSALSMGLLSLLGLAAAKTSKLRFVFVR